MDSVTETLACLQCNITFTKKQNLRRHLRNIHAQTDIKITGSQVCSDCNAKFRTILDLHDHIQKNHPDIKLQFQTKMFYSQSDFEQWKAEIESETVSSYVVYNIHRYKDLVVSQYKCHRSGTSYINNSGRQRNLKKSGSIKTGITCPSMIKTRKQTLDNGIEILVEYQSTHSGHKCEADKLPLLKEERCILANMLSAGISTTAIIEKMKEQYSPTKRLWYLTKQELYNICRDFNIHVQKDSDLTCNQVCGVCIEKCRTILDLHRHIQRKHPEIQLEFQEKVYYCQSEFDQWKAEVERESVSCFTLFHTHKSEDSVVRHYRCHKSGLPVIKRESESNRRSKKTGVTCPAVIKVIKRTLGDGFEILVEYQSTHLGHMHEESELPLQNEKQSDLAVMPVAGIQTSTTLGKTKEESSPTKRLSHTPKQDLYICPDFGVSDVAHKDDTMAVDVIVRKMMNEGYNPVWVYQPQGESLDGDYIIDVSEIEISQNEETDLILNQVSKKPKLDLDDEKSEIKEYFQNISQKMEAVESVKDLTFVKNHLKNIQAYLDSSTAE